MAFDIKAATPDTTLPTTGFVIGADSQAATDPSIYSVQTLWTALSGSTSLTGATVTTSKPLLDLTQTWNDGAVNFTALKLNVTNTASAAGAMLMDLQVGGTSLFKVEKTGGVRGTSGVFSVLDHLVGSGLVRSDTGLIQLTTDVNLYGEAAQVLAQRNSTNAQTFRIYNTYTDASNYERAKLEWASNVLKIGMDGAGTGSIDRSVRLVTSAEASFIEVGQYTERFKIQSTETLELVANSAKLMSGADLQWSAASSFGNGSDIGLARAAAGILKVTNASTGGGALQFIEQTAPSAGSTNEVRIYAEDNGSGKTRLMALFATGAAQQIAIEP